MHLSSLKSWLTLATVAALSCGPAMAAHPRDTYWTNVDGVTIWARLTGIQGRNVLLVKNGRTYRVPTDRLTADSVRKARLLLGMPDAEPSRVAATSNEQQRVILADIRETPMPETSSNEDGKFTASAALLPPRELPPEEPLRLDPPPATDEIRLAGNQAVPPVSAPSLVRTLIAAGNGLQNKRYKWGGGHSRLEDSGYDCSGSVSHVLIKAGLLRKPITSGAFTRYGQAGPGRWVTIYARHGHVFMTICGLRLDTGYHGRGGESGPRWCRNSRPSRGFVTRHPPGL